MSKKPSSPLYANVSGVKYKREKSTTQNEPTYYNTVPNKIPQPTQGIYSNVNYREKSNNMYSNTAKTGNPIYENTQYPLYDNVKPLGLLLLINIFFLIARVQKYNQNLVARCLCLSHCKCHTRCLTKVSLHNNILRCIMIIIFSSATVVEQKKIKEEARRKQCKTCR